VYPDITSIIMLVMVPSSLTGPDVNTVILNSDDEQILPTFVEQAHANVRYQYMFNGLIPDDI